MLQINYFHDISRLKEGKILLRDLKKKKRKLKLIARLEECK